MYELYDPCTIMFFFRNKHIMIDLGTGNNNKINWAMTDKQEFIDIVETVYRGARKGRGLVVSPKGVHALECLIMAFSALLRQGLGRFRTPAKHWSDCVSANHLFSYRPLWD